MLRSQTGSAMIYIFIAIALLAGLFYAMNQESRVNTSVLSEERAHLLASEIIEKSNIYAMAVQKLLLRGCDETEISFENALHPSAASYVNAGSPADNSCHVFHPAGGGVALESISLPEDSLDTAFSGGGNYGVSQHAGNYCIFGIGTGTTVCNDSNKELLYVATALKQSVCEAINQKLGINLPDGTADTEDLASEAFDGSFATGITNLLDPASIQNKQAFCLEDNSAPTIGNHFYYSTLKAR